MMLFRSLVLGLLGAIALLELAQLHTHIHDRDLQPHVLVLSEEDAPEPASPPSALDNTVIVDVERATIERYLARPSFLADAHIAPWVVAGNPSGLLFQRIEPGSLFAILGFESGDIIERINDVPVPIGAHGWLERMPSMDAPGFLDIDIMRGDRPLRIVVLLH